MSLLASYFQQRNAEKPQFFIAIGGQSDRTVLFTSHIWWTDLMVFSLLKQGYNVVITQPWYFSG